MIVVVGLPAYRETGGEAGVGGPAAGAAVAAREAGRDVELAGKVGDDAAGDAVVLALGRLGIGHAALLRDATLPTPLVVEPSGVADAGDPETGTDEAPVAQLLPADAAARPGLEAADVALGLQYLAGAAVVVLAEPLPAEAVAAAVEGAAFSGAQLVVVVAPGAGLPALPSEATVLEAPEVDDGSFARLVGCFAAGLDRGSAPAEAFAEAVRSVGWEESGGGEETAS
jgi:sugar/nucleoside kinase (ribokinase family)